MWQFGQFHPQNCIITQDFNLHRLPAPLEELLQIPVLIP